MSDYNPTNNVATLMDRLRGEGYSDLFVEIVLSEFRYRLMPNGLYYDIDNLEESVRYKVQVLETEIEQRVRYVRQ